MLENERIFTVKCDNVKFEREMKTKNHLETSRIQCQKERQLLPLIISPQLIFALFGYHLAKCMDFQLTVSGLCLHSNGDFT